MLVSFFKRKFKPNYEWTSILQKENHSHREWGAVLQKRNCLWQRVSMDSINENCLWQRGSLNSTNENSCRQRVSMDSTNENCLWQWGSIDSTNENSCWQRDSMNFQKEIGYDSEKTQFFKLHTGYITVQCIQWEGEKRSSESVLTSFSLYWYRPFSSVVSISYFLITYRYIDSKLILCF